MEKFDLAIEDFTKAIELYPNCSEYYYNRSSLYALKKNKIKMLKDLHKSIILDSNLKKNAKKDRDFKEFWDDLYFKKVVNKS